MFTGVSHVLVLNWIIGYGQNDGLPIKLIINCWEGVLIVDSSTVIGGEYGFDSRCL